MFGERDIGKERGERDTAAARVSTASIKRLSLNPDP
jgi:hypothetical protein